MKAVIVELNNDRAAVLSDDGCVITVKNRGYEIGQIIQIKKDYVPLTRKLSALAASAAAFVILGTGLWAYASPYAYVSVDVNPSIEFSINRFDRVIHVKGVNDDGKEILEDIPLDHLKNKTIKEALVSTVDEITDAGYFDGTENGGIVIAASCADIKAADKLADRLEQTVKQTTEENGNTVEVEAFHVGLENVKEAKELGVTPGKLHIVKKLQEAAGISDTIDIEEWLHKPVKDIMKATTDYTKASKAAGTSSSDDRSVSSPDKDKASNVSQKGDNDSGKVEKEQVDSKTNRDNTSESDISDNSSANKAGKSDSSKGSSSKNARKQNKGASDPEKNPGMIHKDYPIDKKPSSSDTKIPSNKETDNDASVNSNSSDITKSSNKASKENMEGAENNTNSAPESNKTDSENSDHSNLQTKDSSQIVQNGSGNTEAGNKNSSGDYDSNNDNKAAGTDIKEPEKTNNN